MRCRIERGDRGNERTARVCVKGRAERGERKPAKRGAMLRRKARSRRRRDRHVTRSAASRVGRGTRAN